MGETRIVEQVGEATLADATLRDVFVTIQSTSAIALGVVGVDAGDAVEADALAELLHHLIVGDRVTQVVSRCKQVAGIETDAETLRRTRCVDHLTDLPNLVSQGRALAGRRLEQHFRHEAARRSIYLIQRINDATDAGVYAFAHVRPGVNDESGDAEGLASFELVDECGHTLLTCRVVGRGQIDQIAGMGHHGVDTAFRLRGTEQFHLLFRERTGRPLPLILDKDLQAITANANGLAEGKMQPPCHGQVRAEALANGRSCHDGIIRETSHRADSSETVLCYSMGIAGADDGAEVAVVSLAMGFDSMAASAAPSDVVKGRPNSMTQ